MLWPSARDRVLELGGPALGALRRSLAAPWGGIDEIDAAGGQLSVGRRPFNFTST